MESIKKIEGIKEAYSVTGDYDIIAKLEVKELKEIGEIVVNKIHRIKGVKAIRT